MQDCYFYSASDHDKHLLVESFDDEPLVNLELINSVNTDAMLKNVKRVLNIKYNLGKHRPILILEGYRLYDDSRIRDLIDLPIFIHLDNMTIRERRYSQGDPDHEYVQMCLLPSYVQYRHRCRYVMNNLLQLDGKDDYDDLCNKIKDILVKKADVTYPLMDFRTPMFQF